MKVYGTMTGPLMVNTYLAVDEESKKAFIVDPGGYSPEITETVNEEKLEVEYIILTHGHGDHICGVEEFMAVFPGAKLVAAETERELLGSASLNMSTMTCGKKTELTPDIFVKDGDFLDVGNTHLTFAMTPGHTVGGMCIMTDEEVFSGDTLFQSSIGRTDFPGGSYEELINSIKQKLMCLPDDTKVYPGHMGATTIGHERQYNPFL